MDEPSIKTRGITSQQFLNYLRNILIEENTVEESRKRAENEFGLQKIALQEFTRFQKLPLELRNLVWNYAREEAAGPRVVEIRNTSGPRRYLQASFPQARRTALFNLRRVNKEAYDVVMEKYTPISCRDLGMQPEGFKKHDHLLLHLKSDVVLFSSCWCHSDPYRSQVFKPRLESHAAKLEIVAVNVTSHNFEEMVRLFFQPILKGLKKMILNISRWDHRYCGLPISFTELRDKDDEDYKFFLGKWNEQIGYLENPGHLKSVEVVIVKATRINPPKLLSMMVERRYNQVRAQSMIVTASASPNLTTIRRIIPTTPLNGIRTLLRSALTN